MTLFRATALLCIPTLTVAGVLLSGSAKPLRAAANRWAGPALPAARLVGVMVNPEIASGDDENRFPSLAFQGTMAKTKLALVVDDPDGGLIGLDRERSEVTKLMDDRGRSLVEKDAPFPPFGFGERVLKGGHRLALELEGTYAPTSDAKVITAVGTPVVRTAHEKQTYTSEMVDCAKGTQIEAGRYAFTVAGNGKAQWGDGYELELETDDSLDAVVSYVAVHEDGTRTDLEVRSTMTFGGKSRIGLFTEAPVEKAMIEGLAWKDARVRKVPFDVRAQVGLD